MEVEELLSRLGESITVRRAFGEAYERDGCLVIPVAWVAGGGGGGTGAGTATAPGQTGEGSGGGFGGVTWPLGVYVVQGGTVRWVPAVDVSRLVFAVVGLARALVRRRARR